MSRLTVAESLQHFAQWLRKLLVLNSFYLIIMAGFRFASLCIYGQKSQWTSELFKAFWMGLRFDSVILGYFLIIPSLFLIFALHWRRTQMFERFGRFVRPYYTVVLSVAAILLAIDTQYYSYFQDHFNILVFGLIEDDTVALLYTFWKNYPVLWYFAFTALGLWLIFKLVNFQLRSPRPPSSTSSEKIHFGVLPLVSFVLIVVLFFLGRGSFGLFPLGPADTVISKDPFLNHLSNNGIHALFRAFKLRNAQSRWDYNMKAFGYSEAKQAFADYYRIPMDQVPENPLSLFHQHTPKNIWAEKTKPHVIVFMMESFGGFWLQYHSPDFNLLGAFEPHMKEDLFLKNFLPSSGATVGSLSSIMISAPQSAYGSFLTESQYLQVPFRSSPARVFSRAGYETHFIYGGNPGWRDMNKFARFQGFDHVEGDVDMQAKLGPFKEVHDWGVYDEDVFRYVMTLLKEATKPQMILVMTTTNHPPYQLPSTFKVPAQKIPPALESRLIGDRNIINSRFRTYYYSNQKLGEFISQLKASPFGEKTILAATGDHSFNLVNFTDEELLQKWSVPFYLYTPKAVKPTVSSDTFGSHMDIFPTLYSLSLSDVDYDALGVNLLDLKAPHYALHSTQVIAGPEGAAQLAGKSPARYFDWQGHFEKLVPSAEDEPKKAMATRYKALMSLLDYYFMAEKKTERK